MMASQFDVFRSSQRERSMIRIYHRASDADAAFMFREPVGHRDDAIRD
jgi:hypothetical protein